MLPEVRKTARRGPFWFHHLVARLSLQLQIIQRSIHRQFPQHDQLRNPQQHMQ